MVRGKFRMPQNPLIRVRMDIFIPDARSTPYVMNGGGDPYSEDAVHHAYLNVLRSNMRLIGESRREIRSIIMEPDWFESPDIPHKLCDLILVYRDGGASSVELKGSSNGRDEAIRQLIGGRDYIHQVLNRDFRYGLFVVYTKRGYRHERIGPRELGEFTK